MPLSQVQKDAISKIQGGSDILAEVDSYETSIATLTENNRTVSETSKALEAKNKALTKENVSRKRAMQLTSDALKVAGLDPVGGEFGLEPPVSLQVQIENLTGELKSSATKDMKPSAEVEAVKKELAAMKANMESEKNARLEAEKTTKLATVKAAIAPKLPEHFGNAADLILENGIANGRLTTNDAGEPGVMMNGEFIALAEEEGAKAMNALKQMYPKQAVAKQKGGAGDTPANGGTGKQGSAKTITAEEYDRVSALGDPDGFLVKFFGAGGQIAPAQ